MKLYSVTGEDGEVKFVLAETFGHAIAKWRLSATYEEDQWPEEVILIAHEEDVIQ